MSIKVFVYTPTLSAEFIPQVAVKFSEFGMQCQFHPNFALDSVSDSGVVPLSLRVSGSEMAQYENVEMLSSFEIAFKDFHYTSPPAFNPGINEKLKKCTKQIIIRMNAVPTSSLRVGLYFASFVAQVSDGIVYFPRSDDYMDAAQALDLVAQEVTVYERDMPADAWSVEAFSGWLD